MDARRSLDTFITVGSIRSLEPFAVSFCVAGGTVVAYYSAEPPPVGFLLRPALVVLALALVIGLASTVARRFDVLAAASLTVLVAFSFSRLTLVGLGTIAIVWLLLRIAGREEIYQRVLTTMSVVFFAAGLATAVPHMTSLGIPDTVKSASDSPIYLVLLDGYPRNDTLIRLGIDNSPFVAELGSRGFDYYPDAQSTYGYTYLTLSNMLTGGYDGPDEWGEPRLRSELQKSWRLPGGFVAVAPPVGGLAIPGAKVINPGGFNLFEEDLLRRSLIAHFPGVGDLVMDGLRRQLERAIEAVATTEEPRVFAHLLAPHTPFLYSDNGEPSRVPKCWPTCNLFALNPDRLEMSTDQWAKGMGGYISYLNHRILKMIDEKLDNHPDAVIVLFSDHGGRFDPNDPMEWHATFLAARTPRHPRAFEEQQSPDSLMRALRRLGYLPN